MARDEHDVGDERRPRGGGDEQRASGSRKTVAACFDYILPFSGGYQAKVRRALDEHARRRGLNLVTVFGRALKEPDGQSDPYNAVYDLIHPDHVDGVIIVSATLGSHCGAEGLQRFAQRYRGMPVCSLGIAVPEIPSVTLDNRRGMAALMDHVLGHHGHRRVAFIAGAAGSAEAEARLEAYRQALERHDVAFDPELVVRGDFRHTLGETRMQGLLESGIPIDAVVAANDLMALGALAAIRKHGVGSRGLLPISGFDDIPAARQETPPLTTAAQPYAAMAARALDVVVDQIEGRKVPANTELPAQVVIRSSCGCAPPVHRDRTGVAERERSSSDSDDDSRSSTDETSSKMATHAEPTKHQVEADESIGRIISIGERISTAFDIPSLAKTLGDALLSLGIQTVFLSRFVDDARTELEPLMSLAQGIPVPMPCRRFPARHLFPLEAYPRDKRWTLAAFPVVYEARLQGVVVFDYDDDSRGYQLVRDQIATGMRTVALHQAVVEQTKRHERSLQEQERLATAKRMEALSVLAGGVAHDLNNVLGPLVALPDVMLQTLTELDRGQRAAEELRADLRSIRSASLHAAQTIKDLLTLSRQGRTTKEALDIARVVSDGVEDVQKSLRQVNDRVELVVHSMTTPLVVRASQAHVLRAITNLVRNAAEAIDTAGRVTVELRATHVTKRIERFDTVEPGDYAVVTVADDGNGIAEADLGRLFEPFVSQKRLGEGSGSGLGLAIVRSVVEEHEGFIDVTSVVGEGTTFTLYFPLSHEALPVDVEPETIRHRSAKILVVDDEPAQLRTYHRVLAHLGYEVDVETRAREALTRFERAAASGGSPYDLVILDMMLGHGVDGLELYDGIVDLFPSQKAIVASGYAAVERAESAVERGLGWLMKPYTTDALAQAVHAALSDGDRRVTLASRPPGATSH